MILNLDRAKDLSDTMNKLDRWDALIRDSDVFDKDDISDKNAPNSTVRFGLAGRRDLGNCVEIRCMIDEMIRDKREARGAIRLTEEAINRCWTSTM